MRPENTCVNKINVFTKKSIHDFHGNRYLIFISNLQGNYATKNEFKCNKKLFIS